MQSLKTVQLEDESVMQEKLTMSLQLKPRGPNLQWLNLQLAHQFLYYHLLGKASFLVITLFSSHDINLGDLLHRCLRPGQ